MKFRRRGVINSAAVTTSQTTLPAMQHKHNVSTVAAKKSYPAQDCPVSIVQRLKASPLSDDKWTKGVGLKQVIERSPGGVVRVRPLLKSKGMVKDIEATGPINWSVRDLKNKYRDELLREDVYQASLAARDIASEMAKHGKVICAAKLMKHPLLTSCQRHIQAANLLCIGRGRARCVARRFVLDVHQIWLTNLDHFEASNRGVLSRHKRNDVAAVLTVRSQIQSIDKAHAWGLEPECYMAPALAETPGNLNLPLTLSFKAIYKQDALSVTLLAGEEIIQGDVAYRASAVRKFCPGYAVPPVWHIGLYDRVTGAMATAIFYEEAQLARTASCLQFLPATKSRPIPTKRSLVHVQGCLVSDPGGSMIATTCQVFVCTPHPDDPSPIILFDFVFLSCSRFQSFHIWQTRLETLDIIAQLGLSNAPCTEVKWWCQPGRVHLFTLLLNQFTWKLDKKLRLDVPHDRSSLAWGFNFKSLAMHAMELLDVLTVDTPHPGQERICLSFDRGLNKCSSRSCQQKEINIKACLACDAEESHQLKTQPAASLSMNVAGACDRTKEVPGTTNVGFGVKFKKAYHHLLQETFLSNDLDRTEIVAILYRDYAAPLESIIIQLVQALDHVISSPRHAAWDNTNITPPSAFKISNAMYIPFVRSTHGDISSFVSPVTRRVGECIFVLTGMNSPMDCNIGLQEQSWRILHRRNMPECDIHRFRLKASCVLLMPNEKLNVKLCSLTQDAATPNKGALTGQSTLHSVELCTSILSRFRTVKDYIQTLRKKRHQGANDPGFYKVNLHHTTFRALDRSNFAKSRRQTRVDHECKDSEEIDRLLAEKIHKVRELLEEKQRKSPVLWAKNTRGAICDDNRILGEIAETGGHEVASESMTNSLAINLGISEFHCAASANWIIQQRILNQEPIKMKKPADESLENHTQAVDLNDDDYPVLSLDLTRVVPGPAVGEAVVAWRRLHRNTKATLQSSFMEARIQGVIDSVVNTTSQPTIVGIVHPAAEVKYEPMVFRTLENDCILMTEVLEATVRSLEQQKGIKVDSGMSAKDRLLAQSGNAASTAADEVAELQNAAFVRCKLGHVDGVEECLDQEVAIENRDEHGNTLFIISAQQNNKKMIKMLLRRGADVNAQNSTGNTALHYANEYKFNKLSEYILNKGGNDTLLNTKGLTCYEGVNGVH